MNNSTITSKPLKQSKGLTAYEAILNNPNAQLLDSVMLDGKPIFAVWESENIQVLEPDLQEVCLTFHITGSIRVRNNIIGNNNVKLNSIALYGLNSYEWNIYNKLRYAHLYFWKDFLDFNPDELKKILQLQHLHGIKDNWVEGLFKMIMSYENNHDKKIFILKMYKECFKYLLTKYLKKPQQKPIEVGGCTSYQVRKLHEFIEDNYFNQINIDHFCTTMHWSRSHLFREFKKTFGTSPYNFLLQKRFFIAKQLIESGHSLEEILQLSGIENTSKLNYLFNKNLGISAKQFAQLSHM